MNTKTSEIVERVEDGLRSEDIGIQKIEVKNSYPGDSIRLKLTVVDTDFGKD